MGAVFEAEHVRLGRKVALKVMRPIYMQYREHVARFLQEARAASQVKHANVVEILDVGETPRGTVYTVMEFLDGEDLASVLRREQRLPWPQVHAVLVQVVAALEAAHEQGVIHRDVKPANCILIRGKNDEIVLKMVDFGIAKFNDGRLSDEDPLTKTGEVIGTPAYMAPELSLGKPANARTDIYSVGVLAYQMLSGTRPFSGATAVEMHINQTTRTPPSLRARFESIPVSVESLILQMLAVTPGDRPATMSRVAAQLRTLAPRSRHTLPMLGDFSQLHAKSPLPSTATPGRRSARMAETVNEGPPSETDGGLLSHVEEARDPSTRGGDATTVRVESGPLSTVLDEADDDSATLPVDSEDLERLREARPGVPQPGGKETLPMGSSSTPEEPETAEPAPQWGPEGSGRSPARRTMLASESGPPARRTMLASEGGPLAKRTMLASEGGPLARRTMLASESGVLQERVASSSNEGIPVPRAASPSRSIEGPAASRSYPPWVVTVVMVSLLGAVAAAGWWWPEIMAFLGR